MVYRKLQAVNSSHFLNTFHAIFAAIYLHSMHKSLFLSAVLFAALVSCNEPGNSGNGNGSNADNGNPAPSVLSYSIVKIYPHDTTSFTEGLIWFNNALYEGTGNKGSSRLIKTNIETGKTEKDVKLTKDYFGEGITILNNKIYQLTWQEHKAFVYDLNTFQKLQEFEWPFEGWGMTNNGKELIISTGSSNLYFVNPDNFKISKTVSVTDNYGPVGNINELEYVNGIIYANNYLTRYILRIDPESGRVTGKLDLTTILDSNGVQYDPNKIDVLNGIASNTEKNTLYVTGKYWPALFEIKISQ